MKNGGKCGICGDAWDQPPPRNHERPDGKFVIKSKDFILSRFREGDSIAVNLEITAAHRVSNKAIVLPPSFYLCVHVRLQAPIGHSLTQLSLLHRVTLSSTCAKWTTYLAR